jgi:hypothetical protein
LLKKKILFPAINLPQMHITKKKKGKTLQNGSQKKEYKPIKKKK